MAVKSPGKRPKQFIPVDSAGVQAQLEKIVLSKESPLNLKELAYEFLNSCGGTKGFIKRIQSDYTASRVGSPERARLTEFGMKLIQMATADEEVLDNYDLLDNGDLQRTAQRLISKMGMVEWIDHVCI